MNILPSHTPTKSVQDGQAKSTCNPEALEFLTQVYLKQV